MGLLSFLKRKSVDSPKKAPPVPESTDSVQQARTRARQRLIGAVVLVVLGVAGFSLLFETQPRPISVDTPIEIARRDGSAAPHVAATPPTRRQARPANEPAVLPPSVVTESPAEAGREVVSPAPAAVEVAPPPSPAKPLVTPSAAVAEKKPEPRPTEVKPAATKPADAARAQALLDGKEAAASNGRFVVQVGAFAETNAARTARQKVEKLGLKTYTQVVETSAGNRIRVRVGPFASREEADRAAGKIKSAGLPSAILAL